MKIKIKQQLAEIGVKIPEILLPKDGINMTKWSVVACDQFTSEPEYWNQVEKLVGEEPSTYKLVLPEVYLENGDKEERIKKINKMMKQYLKEGILEEKFEGWVLVDRKTSKAESRKGLVMALDLEAYDYHKGAKTLIRATEGTVESRIWPRLVIREEALVELPHIMVLINDPNKTVIEPLFQKKLEKIYDFDLMLDGGHIKGYKIDDETVMAEIGEKLAKLISPDGLLFAMGDGNHSLATAKSHWEKIKTNLNEEEKKDHPARFALVEVVNIHDEGLKFEPIHRVVFNVEADDLRHFLQGDGDLVEMVINDKESWGLEIKDYGSNLPVGNLQRGLDEYLANHPEAKIDYVHGEEAVKKIVNSNLKTVGFLLKGIEKEELFSTVEKDGALPRKTFSMGEAEEKRYYLESRKIVR